MKIEFPPEMQKMLDENENLEVLHVSVVFDKREPLTKKWKKQLANNVYQAALERLEHLSKIQKGSEKISPNFQKLPNGEKGNKRPPTPPRDKA